MRSAWSPFTAFRKSAAAVRARRDGGASARLPPRAGQSSFLGARSSVSIGRFPGCGSGLVGARRQVATAVLGHHPGPPLGFTAARGRYLAAPAAPNPVVNRNCHGWPLQAPISWCAFRVHPLQSGYHIR